jgi:hypothetical protein
VKGGGHNTNPGFSSTSGVEIAMTRFNCVEFDAATGLLTLVRVLLGFKHTKLWSQLGSTSLEDELSTIGVSGLTLGGGQ